VRTTPFLLLAILTGSCASPDATARCFAPDTALPERSATLSDRQLGQSGRDLAAALFDRDVAGAQRLLERDPALARSAVGNGHDMLVVALSTCDRGLVELLLEKGADPNGRTAGVPLNIALRADEPWFALRLLQAGARPLPGPDGANDPMRTAIEMNSAGAVRLLLDHGAPVNHADRLGDRPLQYALDTERFAIAELLLDRGADPWAIDSGGATLGWSVSQPPVAAGGAEEQARGRLRQRLAGLTWPMPVPDPKTVRQMALAGKWPPVAGAAKPSAEVLALIRANAKS
jgi:hypothetical protein